MMMCGNYPNDPEELFNASFKKRLLYLMKKVKNYYVFAYSTYILSTKSVDF